MVKTRRPPGPARLDPVDLIVGILRSCRTAAGGILFAARSQRNFRIHLMAGGVVLIAGWWLRFSPVEMALLVLTAGLVLMGELFNTGMEYMLNVLEARDHPAVKAVKDVVAGGVLMAVIGSVIVAAFLFGPPLARLLERVRP